MFIDKPSGEFKSPGYPIPYNHSLTCEWYITVESRKSVQITIKDLELEIAGDCLADSLIVYSGPDDTAPMITRLCSSISQPSVLTTSGNYAFVRFQSDETSHGKGFIASFITVDSRCGGTFVAESGSIHSINYPQNYDLRVDCMYFIKVEKDRRVNLTFEDFDIVNSENCSSSYVKVYDGNSLDSPLLLTHCGNKLPNSVVSSNNEMLLRMKSDGFYAAKGFLASYKPLCGANIVTSGRGTINYAEGSHFHIDDSDNCSWIIRASELNAKITLHFVVLSIGSSSSETNSIDIYAGDDVTSPLITSISGHVAPPTITVSSSVVLVVYKQSYSTDIFGQFVLDYSVLDSGNSVNFGFLQFNLPFSQACNEDYVEIREGDSGGKLLGIFCGNTLPQNISVGEHVWLKFKSSEDEQTALGFSAAYSLAYDNEITGTKGVIASPLYPLKYKNNGLFTWRVTVKLRQAIKVSFNDVYVLDGECNSEIVVYDGYDSSAQILIEACLPLPEPKISSSNVIFIEFQNYHRMFGTSFLLDWEEVSKVIPETTIKKDVSCVTRVELSGVRGNNNSYDFTSPGFPNGYGHNLHCTWIIETVPQNHLSLNFKVLDLEKSWQCHADYISVYTVCGGSVTGPVGVLTNNGWGIMVCKWYITVRLGHTINVTFTNFNMPIPPGEVTCKRNYVLLRNGGSETSPFLGVGKYCGTTPPMVPISTSNKLYVEVVVETSQQV
ncbi:hypothetical protein AAG570_010370 [Ranatra chinensis]|uniref:CUB domain-containing protein n=1 Tax=Ranatra chinensis TaxID=642074 RepID=A0ABD0YML8_9HEMI